MNSENYKIFISYLEKSAGGYAGHIYTGLKAYFGEDIVFRYVEKTVGGTLWRENLVERVQQCKAFLIIIDEYWVEEEVLCKLKDENAPIHLEIKTAVDSCKWIIPVIVGRAKIPPANEEIPAVIYKAFTDPHYVEFPPNTKRWPEAIREICTAIEKETCIQPRSPVCDHKQMRHQLDEKLCLLDREEEFESVEEGLEQGHQLFLAWTPSREVGIEFFALRCARHFSRSCSPVGMTDVPSLDWTKFSKVSGDEKRKERLFNEIAQCVFLKSEGRVNTPTSPTKQWIQKKIQGIRRPALVYCVAYRDPQISQVQVIEQIREWFEIWADLLCVHNSERLAVILFVELDPKPSLMNQIRVGKLPIHVITPVFTEVEHHEVQGWFDAQIKRMVPGDIRSDLKRSIEGLFKARGKIHFDRIAEVVQSRIATGNNMG